MDRYVCDRVSFETPLLSQFGILLSVPGTTVVIIES